jgi:hypothetical protein
VLQTGNKYLSEIGVQGSKSWRVNLAMYGNHEISVFDRWDFL